MAGLSHTRNAIERAIEARANSASASEDAWGWPCASGKKEWLTLGTLRLVYLRHALFESSAQSIRATPAVYCLPQRVRVIDSTPTGPGRRLRGARVHKLRRAQH